MEIAEFLLARIDEDEREARVLVDDYDDFVAVLSSDPVTRLALASWLARHDPARVLAECDAKRRIVEELASWKNHTLAQDRADDAFEDGLELAARLLALPYASHPDFRPEWSTLADA